MWVLSAATAPAPRPAAAAGQSSALSGWSLLLAASGAFLLEAWEPTPQLDDAFIPFRYARNLAEGYGLVYNPGEFVEGFTNLLWTLLVAAAPWLLWSSPDFARWSVSGILFAACVAAAFASQATGSCVGPPSSWRSPPSRGRRISSGTTCGTRLCALFAGARAFPSSLPREAGDDRAVHWKSWRAGASAGCDFGSRLGSLASSPSQA